MTDSIPLSSLLSQALVAFTIEFDNEWEWRFIGKGPRTVFRASQVMWGNFLRFVPDDGVTVRELSEKAGYAPGKAHPSLSGMVRWGYVTLQAPKKEQSGKSQLDKLIFTTDEGKRSAAVWKPLSREIENRWKERFGKQTMGDLCKNLRTLVCQFDRQFPAYFPVLNHLQGMRIEVPHSPETVGVEERDLSILLSNTIHALTLEFEEDHSLSLALRANVLRVLNRKGIPLKDLPRLSGISKEAIAMAARFLQKHGYAEKTPIPGASRGQQLGLTNAGLKKQDEYIPLLNDLEKRWAQKYGRDSLKKLRSVLEMLVVTPQGEKFPLFSCLDHQSTVWRAQLPPLETLPHHPMVLHRGGWPDGS